MKNIAFLLIFMITGFAFSVNQDVDVGDPDPIVQTVELDQFITVNFEFCSNETKKTDVPADAEFVIQEIATCETVIEDYQTPLSHYNKRKRIKKMKLKQIQQRKIPRRIWKPDPGDLILLC